MLSDLLEKLQKISQQIDHAQICFAKLEQKSQTYQQQLLAMQAKDKLQHSLSIIAEHAQIIDKLGEDALIWGENCSPEQAQENRQRLSSIVGNYATQLTLVQRQQRETQQALAELEPVIDALTLQKLNLLDEISIQQDEYIIEREITLRTAGTDTLPWSDQDKDSNLFKAVLLLTLFIAALTGTLIPRWDIPKEDKIKFIQIPERVARLLLKQEPPPKPVKKQKPEEKIKDKDLPEDKPAPDKEKIKVAKQVAEKTGLLAFKSDFAEIMDASADIKLGSQASILTKSSGVYRQSGKGKGGRSLLTSQLPLSSSAGNSNVSIHREEVSRNNSLKNVTFSHVENLVSTKQPDIQAAVRKESPLKREKTKSTRSDEEIQLVFDRYKDALYRIYNRELRKQPLLKGKLILQLTIEASGLVSKCIIKSSDLNAPELENKIINRVLRFNFGEKPGTSALTILYPIDFLPAS